MFSRDLINLIVDLFSTILELEPNTTDTGDFSSDVLGSLCVFVRVFQDDEQGVLLESFWPQSEPPQAMAYHLRGRVNKPLTPPPTTVYQPGQL